MDRKKLINYSVKFSDEEMKKIKDSGYTLRELFLIGLYVKITEDKCRRGELK